PEHPVCPFGVVCAAPSATNFRPATSPGAGWHRRCPCICGFALCETANLQRLLVGPNEFSLAAIERMLAAPHQSLPLGVPAALFVREPLETLGGDLLLPGDPLGPSHWPGPVVAHELLQARSHQVLPGPQRLAVPVQAVVLPRLEHGPQVEPVVAGTGLG